LRGQSRTGSSVVGWPGRMPRRPDPRWFDGRGVLPRPTVPVGQAGQLLLPDECEPALPVAAHSASISPPRSPFQKGGLGRAMALGHHPKSPGLTRGLWGSSITIVCERALAGKSLVFAPLLILLANSPGSLGTHNSACLGHPTRPESGWSAADENSPTVSTACRTPSSKLHDLLSKSAEKHPPTGQSREPNSRPKSRDWIAF
jgi:hypothetical protein